MTGPGNDDERIRALAWPLSLTCLSTLVLELSLTRLFSVVLYYHYAFLVISIALLGLASGGILARLLAQGLSAWDHRKRMAECCIGAGLSLLPCLYFILGTNISMVVSWNNFEQLSLLYLLCMLPFTAAGIVIASVMAVGSRRVARLYFFDLVGAASGCLLFWPLMEFLGGPNTVLAVGLFWSLAACAWARGAGSIRTTQLSLGSVVLMASVIGLNWNGDLIDVRYMRGMPIKSEVFAKWNTFSRVSVYQDDREELWIELDGGAGTWLSNIDLEGDAGRNFREHLGQTGPEVAFWMSRDREPETLIIGPGGGWDIVRALAAGSPRVAAVEINSIIANDIMRGEFEEYSRGIYTRPEVTVSNEDARTFLSRTEERYDVIQLSQVDTWASSASGAYALTENYLYTVDALQAYLDHLKPDGMVSIGRWEFPEPRETLRLTSVALEALERQGVAVPALHVIVVLESLAEEWPKMGTLIVSKAPFDATRVAALKSHLDAHPRMAFAYAPGLDMSRGAAYARPFQQLILSSDRARFVREYPFDISAVSDDRPFFFFLYRWRHLADGLFRVDLSGDAVNASAQMLLLGILAVSLLAVVGFLLGPLWLLREKFPSDRRNVAPLAYCFCVGIAFILVEIALIQRFVIYLGEPTYSLTVVIFVLLLSGGLGSRLSDSFETGTPGGHGLMAIGGIAIVVGVHLFALPQILAVTQSGTLTLKVVVAAASIFPLGLCMGVPFPAGLRLIAEHCKDCLEWSWAINAAATVLGSVAAIFASMQFGITCTTVIGLGFYGSAAWVSGRIGSTRRSRNLLAPPPEPDFAAAP